MSNVSVALTTNSVFADMSLGVEIADVSFGSSIRLKNVSLANVELEHGAVVGTTSNDYVHSLECSLHYEPQDDEQYDVEVEPFPPQNRSMLGEDFLIRDRTMSDCLYLPVSDTVVLPGCPTQSAGRRRRMRDGDSDHYIYQDTGGNACDYKHARTSRSPGFSIQQRKRFLSCAGLEVNLMAERQVR